MSSMSRPKVRWAGRRLALRVISDIPVFSGFHTNFDAYSKHYHAGWLRFLIWRYLSAFHNRTAGTLVPCAELRDRLQAMGLRNVGVLGRGVDASYSRRAGAIWPCGAPGAPRRTIWWPCTSGGSRRKRT